MINTIDEKILLIANKSSQIKAIAVSMWTLANSDENFSAVDMSGSYQVLIELAQSIQEDLK